MNDEQSLRENTKYYYGDRVQYRIAIFALKHRCTKYDIRIIRETIMGMNSTTRFYEVSAVIG